MSYLGDLAREGYLRTKGLVVTAIVSIALLSSACSQTIQNQSISEYSSGTYIVVLKKPQIQPASLAATYQIVANTVTRLSNDLNLSSPRHVFSAALLGGVFDLSSEQASAMAADPEVAYIEKSQRVYSIAMQSNPVWGLDRIDQEELPLNNSYSHEEGSNPVNVYVLDTGIQTSHVEFGGRAHVAADFVEDDEAETVTDPNGHGTHVAGVIGGATYGVAKNVNLYSVQVLDWEGHGATADIIAGIDWVTSHHEGDSIANVSISGVTSKAMDDAIERSIQSGVTYIVAAGNKNQSACDYSPARIPSVITVGSTANNDTRSGFSNYGSCVTLFAPGSDIKSAWVGTDSITFTGSGTSAAAPYATGAAALYLSKNPHATPAQVKAVLTEGSVVGKISDVGANSPNRLLNLGFLSKKTNLE